MPPNSGNRPPRRRKTGLIIGLISAFLVIVVVGATVVFRAREDAADAKVGDGKPPFDASVPITAETLGSTDPNALFWKMFTAKAVKIQGEHWGMQILIWAFKDTGLDINEYAYSSFGGAAQGANMVYYVDPTTLLPEYVHLEATPSLTADGTPGQGQQLEASRTEYVRPAAIPADPLADRIPWQLSWDLSVR